VQSMQNIFTIKKYVTVKALNLYIYIIQQISLCHTIIAACICTAIARVNLSLSYLLPCTVLGEVPGT